MKFRATKKDDEGGYLIQGVAFSNNEEDCSVGFVLQRRNFPSGKSMNFELGTEAEELGRKLFDLFNDVFTRAQRP